MKTPLLVVVLLTSLAFSVVNENQFRTLKGLKAVAMEVDVSNLPTAERYGLRDYEIGKKMEQMLRENGIQVLTAVERDKDPNSPVLRITISPMIDETLNACAISINLSLRQPIRLANDPSVVVNNIGTWQISAHSLINTRLLLPGVTERVDTYLKEFVDDWRRANGTPPKYDATEKQPPKTWT